ncbi:MAG TPA: class I SAM-dependent methyltransferase, partial [Thermoanaerobaculia bacterium]|nr:class I SAM-dependent methyltransferase [Thermoanaerobaculia bacterium]
MSPHDDRYSRIEYRRLIAWEGRIKREWPLLQEILGTAPSKRILDLGSGTGEHARFLASHGFDVTGVDSSPSMLEKSVTEKAEGNVRFVEGDIRDVDRVVEGKFGAAICVGNVLPHLTEADDLQRFARSLRNVILPGGPVFIQILNYDRIEAKKERALPINFLPDPDDPKATIVFVRLMELQPDGRVIFIPSSLKLRPDREEPLELVSSQRVEVRGWRHKDLERAFRDNGFPSPTTYGAFD